MKAVQVKYQVKESYVEQNKTNIRRVMEKLRTDPIPGMMYSTYTIGDGTTFVHINMAKDAETLDKLNNVEDFTAFRVALKMSEPIQPPLTTDLTLVDAGFEIA